MSLKTTVKRALHSAGVASTLPRRDGASFILAAHVVQEAEAEPLADVVRLLRRSFSLVSLDEMLGALRAGRCRNLATLTFDDGLRNQMTVAYDVLSGLRAPATFYVCPALVGTPLSTWTWELAPRLSRMSAHRQREIYACGSADSFEPFLQTLKEMPLARREAIWAEIVSATPHFSFTAEEARLFGLMDWVELAGLDRSLITIGSHTHTHADLPQVDDGRLESELAASKAMLREQLGRDVRHFAYPNGSHDPRSASAVARHFDSGVTMEPRAVGPGSDPRRLPRVHIQGDAHELVWILARIGRG